MAASLVDERDALLDTLGQLFAFSRPALHDSDV